MKTSALALPTSVLVMVLCLAGCQDRSTTDAPPAPAAPASAPAAPPPEPAPAAAPASAPATDRWLGQWNGPEGTFLQLAGGNGTYEVTIRDLDGPRTFSGVAAGERIEFERDGVKESVHATNGADTGMKWLTEKSNCLTVRVGEGYCRD